MNKPLKHVRVDANELRTIIGTQYRPIALGAFDEIWRVKVRDKDGNPILDKNGKQKIRIVQAGKVPRGKKWQTASGKNAADIVTECIRSNWNVGLALKPDQLVIDVDVRNGGDIAFNHLCEDLDLNPDDWPRENSPTGGPHYFLKLPPDVRICKAAAHPDDDPDDPKNDRYRGLEFLSAGNQVLAAGCVHPIEGKHYTRDPLSLPREEAPMCAPRLLALIRRKPRDAEASDDLGPEITPDQLRALLTVLEPVHFAAWEKWRNLMFAAHRGTRGSEEGLEAFGEWCGGNPDFPTGEWADQIAAYWNRVDRNDRDDIVTVKTLFKAVSDTGKDGKALVASLTPSVEDDFEGEELPSEENDAEEVSEYTADAFDGEDKPDQEWIVENMVPADDVTLNMGDGGAGKTTIMLQLLVAKTVGKEWLGADTGEAGRTAFFSGEERRRVIQRRLNDIVNGASSPYQGAARVTWKDLRELKIFGLSDRDALLALPDKSTGRIKPTALYAWVDRKLGEWKPALVVFDALYDIYGGDENAKAQVRQFVFLMRKLTHKHGCAIIVTGHPSLFGMQSGMGTSGSTAWSNAFRSRLYTTKEKSKRGVETHKIAAMKVNYGKPDTAIETYWDNGIFVPIFEDEEARIADAQRSKDKFLELLATYTKEGRKVSHAVGSNFAPTIFARDNRSDGIDMQGLRDAMNELFAERKIVAETQGSGSHASTRIVMVKK